MTKTAVAGTVRRVKSVIEEEANLRVRVQDDLVFITGEFEMMQSFLSASNTGERASKNPVVRMWVRQLRDLAFDVEDCVEFILHLDKPSCWDWVRRLLASPVIECMTKPPLPLDVAVGEIKMVKARVEDISKRNTRYNLITGDSSPADSHHQLTSSTGSSKATSGALQILLDAWKAGGRLGGHTGNVLKRLIDSHASGLQVISLWRSGSSDVGDDAHAIHRNYVLTMKKAYEDPEICQHFKNRARVKLSAFHPFNPVEFVNSLLNQFGPYRHNHANANSSISELLQQLKQLRYLVVIEQELTTVADWDDIRMCLPDGNNGSRVVISTNILGIALACTGDTYQVTELKRFSHDRCLYAFFPKLMTLDVRYTCIVQLPSRITKLQKLQYISAGTTTETCPLLVQGKPSTPPPSPPTPQPSPLPTPQEDGHANTSPCARGTAAAANVISTKEAWKRKAAELVESCRSNWWKLKNNKNLRSRRHLYENGGGVEDLVLLQSGLGT